MMNEWLRDLYAHQAGADAEHWTGMGAQPAAREDTAIRQRLHHIHFVQHAFLWTVGPRDHPFAVTKAADLMSFDQLRESAREYHVQAPLLRELSEARMTEPVSLVWFNDPPLTITVA